MKARQPALASWRVDSHSDIISSHMLDSRKMLRTAAVVCLAALLIAALTLAPIGAALAVIFLFCFFSAVIVSSSIPRPEQVSAPAQQIAWLPSFSPRPPPLR
ncbi:MAG TPA: hypothetical protein VIY66_11760 [Candidatus Acidoferrales bacterium]